MRGAQTCWMSHVLPLPRTFYGFSLGLRVNSQHLRLKIRLYLHVQLHLLYILSDEANRPLSLLFPVCAQTSSPLPPNHPKYLLAQWRREPALSNWPEAEPVLAGTRQRDLTGASHTRHVSPGTGHVGLGLEVVRLWVKIMADMTTALPRCAAGVAGLPHGPGGANWALCFSFSTRHPWGGLLLY